jgi:DNA (cytosine-5)-methyltransferase 1
MFSIYKYIIMSNNNIKNKNEDIKPLKVGTFFTGIGAFEHSLLLNKIPHKIIFACDIDKYCKTNFLNNYELNKDNWYDDINTMDGNKYLNKIDILVGGCPCQSFSIAGQRKGLDDLRGQLVFKYIKKIDEIKPNMFIFENVKGLLSSDKGNTFKLIIEEMDKINFKIEFRTIKATKVGMPQSRERIFIIGTNKYKNINYVFDNFKECKLILKLKDLLDSSYDEKYIIKNHKWQSWIFNQKYLNKQTMKINGEIIICQTARQYSSWFGNFIIEMKNCDDFTYSNEAINCINLNKFIPFNYDKDEFDLEYIKNNTIVRRLTPNECLKLMGFDTNKFKTVVSDSQTYKQCGNSIVVNMFTQIIKAIDIPSIIS